VQGERENDVLHSGSKRKKRATSPRPNRRSLDSKQLESRQQSEACRLTRNLKKKGTLPNVTARSQGEIGFQLGEKVEGANATISARGVNKRREVAFALSCGKGKGVWGA